MSTIEIEDRIFPTTFIKHVKLDKKRIILTLLLGSKVQFKFSTAEIARKKYEFILSMIKNNDDESNKIYDN